MNAMAHLASKVKTLRLSVHRTEAITARNIMQLLIILLLKKVEQKKSTSTVLQRSTFWAPRQI